MFINNEALKVHLKKLQNACDGAIVIVEGKRDVAALRSLLNANSEKICSNADFLGLKNSEGRIFSVFILNNGTKRSLYETAEHIASKYRSAILLLDADKKGMELRKKMSSYLRSHGVRVLEEKKLLTLARVRNVEDLCSVASIMNL
jgi:5S rRNA maturation endonuclease (ribonuclease M5)